MVALAALTDWRTALLLVGGFGLAFAALMLVLSADFTSAEKAKKQDGDSWGRLLTSPKILMLFLFYVCSSGANSGMVHFSVVAFKDIYDLPVAVTAVALTAYQGLALLAVLPGGWMADKIENHEAVLALAFGTSGVLILAAGLGFMPFWVVIGVVGIAGALRGLVNASRDISVRNAATDVSVGTLFAFVTTGYSGGQIVGPALYGWLMDTGHPQLVFWVSAAFSFIAIGTMMVNRATPALGEPKRL
jgi:predicted MFS family arabinose efflux permease